MLFAEGEREAEREGEREAAKLLSFFHRKAEEERPQPAPGLSSGKVVGDFRLVALIGQGGMGQVWEAEQVSLGKRHVAVKFVRPERVTERQLELFAREARAGGRLRHQGIVTIHGYGQSEGLAWIAMEFVSGAWTLRDFMDEVVRADEVPEGYDRHVAHFVAEVADAVHAAHEAGVIHRDLKPQNILIAPDEHPKVTDFGLARITDESAMSQTGDFAGTYFYMSPEQVAARRAGIDHRTDIFSLGIVLYELLALRRPFEGDTSHQVAAQILAKDPPAIRTIRSRVPLDLAVIAGKALEKDPDKRFATMKELAADLRRFLANEPIHARPPTRLDRTLKWVKRNPTKSTAAGIAAVAFTAITWLLVQNIRTNRALSTERTNLTQANVALKTKTAEAETSAAEALENARVAKTNEQRADREARAATRRADEVLRLSALQKLDDLVAEADRLWPAHPENIARYEAWLGRAEALVSELSTHEAKLAELRAKARPWTAEEQAESRSSLSKAQELENLRRELEFLKQRSATMEAAEPTRDPSPADVGVDWASLPADANALNSLAWPLVDPERKDFGGEARGLLLARRALELASEVERAEIRDTLAWALFALGRFDEAQAEEDHALAESAADKQPEFEGNVAKLKQAIEAEISSAGMEKSAEHVTKLAGNVAAIEQELSTRPEWTFEDDEDKWWHNQLEKLVSGLKSFADEETGSFSDGTSAEHGWGMRKRLGFARSQREGFADGEYGRAWSGALPEIRAVYSGLALTPQLGLVPIGPDPDSNLWEFAHFATGEPAVRGPDGRLVLKEETGLVFVLLPGGTLQMGAQKSDPNGVNYDPKADPNESPVHAVALSAFFLSKYEMTQGQWQRFTGRNPSAYDPKIAFGGKQTTLLHPVEQVNWPTCSETLGRLGLDLPTEAQWEYAARAGTTSAWWTGSEEESLEGAANLADSFCKKNGGPSSWVYEDWLDDGCAVHAPVGSFQANAFGLHDVIGNVWEWCRDLYDDYGKRARPGDGEREVGGSSLRVSRGGGFGFPASDARSAYRRNSSPGGADGDLGLRPARRITP